MTQSAAPGAVEPHSGPAVVVPLPLCPWYFECVIMYARYERRCLFGTGTEAELLVKLLTSWTVLLQGSSDSFDSVRELGYRIKVLPEKAALYFCCKVCSSVRRERSVFPLTVMTPRGPGILSLR